MSPSDSRRWLAIRSATSWQPTELERRRSILDSLRLSSSTSSVAHPVLPLMAHRLPGTASWRGMGERLTLHKPITANCPTLYSGDLPLGRGQIPRRQPAPAFRSLPLSFPTHPPPPSWEYPSPAAKRVIPNASEKTPLPGGVFHSLGGPPATCSGISRHGEAVATNCLNQLPASPRTHPSPKVVARSCLDGPKHPLRGKDGRGRKPGRKPFTLRNQRVTFYLIEKEEATNRRGGNSHALWKAPRPSRRIHHQASDGATETRLRLPTGVVKSTTNDWTFS